MSDQEFFGQKNQLVTFSKGYFVDLFEKAIFKQKLFELDLPPSGRDKVFDPFSMLHFKLLEKVFLARIVQF